MPISKADQKVLSMDFPASPAHAARLGRLVTAGLVLHLAMVGIHVSAQESSGNALNVAYERAAADQVAFNKDVALRLADARAHGDKQAELLALRDKFVLEPPDASMTRPAPQLDQAIALARTLGQIGTEAVLLSEKATFEEAQGRRDEAERLLEQAVQLAERSGDKDALITVYAEYGGYWYGTRGDLALHWLERGLTLSVARHEHARQAVILSRIGQVLRHSELASTDELAKVEAYLQRAIALLKPERHRSLLIMLREDLGITYLRQEKLDQARAAWEQALSESQILQLRNARLHFHLASVDLKQNRPAAAKERLLKALADERDPSSWTIPRSLAALARAESQLGRRDAAMDTIERARPLIQVQQFPKLRIEFQASLAEIAARAANYKLAYEATQSRFDIERSLFMGDAAKRMEELSVKFDLKLKEADNQLLKAQQASLESKRAALVLALILAALVMAGALLFLLLQLKQRRRFEILALRDELTGAPNRRSMLEHLRRECARPAPARADLTVSILDIDFFKKVNDTYGHDAGDAVLKAFYTTCRAKLRPEDVLGRWGVEEFVLVTGRANPAALDALFERLLDAAKAMDLPELKGERIITFSMGACRVGNDGEPNPETILARADAALYAAKETGRACWRMGHREDAPAVPVQAGSIVGACAPLECM